MPTTNLINLPSATSSLASVGAFSAPVFDNLLPIGLMGAGLIVGGFIVYAVAAWIIHGVSILIHPRGDSSHFDK